VCGVHTFDPLLYRTFSVFTGNASENGSSAFQQRRDPAKFVAFGFVDKTFCLRKHDEVVDTFPSTFTLFMVAIEN